MKICLYTALFGDLTELKQPAVGLKELGDAAHTDGRLSLVCFSDRPRAPNGWRVKVVTPTYNHPRLDSKWYRMMPHLELRQYDLTIWVDATFQLGNVRSFVDMCLETLRSDKSDGYGSALFQDPECLDIYHEAAFSINRWPNKYPAHVINAQVNHYRAEGLPNPHKMYGGGIHVRDNRVEWVRRMNLLWFTECIRWSHQDQISLPYVLWKMGKTCATIPGYLYEGKDWHWVMVNRDQ